FRRVLKKAIQSAMDAGAAGIKVQISGRVGGAEIARTEWYKEGRIPLHTLRTNIDFAMSRAETTYGSIGIKIWVNKGEDLERQ
ncbi:MAG: 30S ribosomal protein S3, partial [Chlamydiota bacterium]